MKPNPKLLLVDDDPATSRMLKILLEAGRYKVAWARSGQEGLAMTAELRPDVIVLELRLPDIDGFLVLQALRDWNSAPVMILSSRSTVSDKVHCLDAGANDFLTKPFDSEELLARLRVIQRTEPAMTAPPTLIAGPLRVNMASHEVTINSQVVELTATEEAIFYLLARHAGCRVSCVHLISAVWGTDLPAKIDELREYIWRLRRKLVEKGVDNLIRADGGIGYTLVPFPTYRQAATC